MTNVTTHRRAASIGRKTTPSHPQQNVAKLTPDELIDDYVLKRIEFRAKQLAIQFRLSDDRRDDLQQEMVVELLKASARFDQTGSASWHTYACRVLDLSVKKLIQIECRMRQREAGRPMGFSKSPDGCPSAVNNPAHEGEDELAQLEMKLDIDLVMSRMPARLRQVCELLKKHSPTEAAEVMGIHRNSIYRLIAQAREYFEKIGLGFEENSAADSACVRM
ncbi:MAG: sigma-70 family RNA polymerase sigma factor [Pirellulales bacterium]